MSEYEFWKDLGNIFDSILTYQKKNAEFNSRFINPWIRLGNIFDRDDQHKEAVQAYRMAIEIDPDSPQNWADLGDAQFRMGAHEEALASYAKAIELDPKAPWPVSNLALTLVTLGRCEEAIPLYLKSIELSTEDKDRAVTWNRLGNAYRKLNDYENAFLAFQQADELDGENTGFRDQLDESTETETLVAPEEVLDRMEMEGGEAVGEIPQAADAVPVDEPEPAAEIPAEEPAVREESRPEAMQKVEPPSLPGEEVPQEMMISEEEPLPAWLVEEALDEQSGEPEAETAEAGAADEVSRVIEEIVALGDLPAVQEPVGETVVVAAAEIPLETPVDDLPAEAAAEAPLETPADDLPVEAADAAVVEEEAAMQASTDTTTTLMEGAEAYTEFTSTPVVDPSTLEDTRPVRAVRRETLEIDADPAPGPEAAAEPEPAQAVPAPIAEIAGRGTDESAYEEFLKDAAGPAEPLSDHVEALQALTPVTRVSQNGEVRIAMDTQNAHVWNELGNVYLNSGACDDAVASYSKAIELDRQFAWPYSNLALAYVQKGRFAEAILLYQRSIELFASDKDKAVTWNRLGNVYRRLNDYANAIAAYQTADDLDPDNATLSLRSHYGLLGNLYLNQKSTYVS